MSVLASKQAITRILSGDAISPAITNQPSIDLETNIDNIFSYLNTSMTGYFEQDVSTTTGLVFGYRAAVIRDDAIVTSVAAGTVNLIATAVNYVEVDSSGNVSVNTTGYTSGRIPLWKITTDATSITALEDNRTHIFFDTDKALLPANNTFTGTNTFNKTVYLSKGVDIPSASTLTIGVDGNYFDVTGTTNVTALSTLQAGTRVVLQFDSVLTIVNSANLILPNNKDITTVPGIAYEFISEGAGVWRYLGTPVISTDQVQGWTYQQYFVETTLTDAANISWDLDTNQVAKVTLGGDRTLDNPSNMKAGAMYTLRIIQDATGSRLLSFGTAYKFPGGVVPTLTSTANAVDIITFICDGTNMYGIFQGDFK